MLAVVLICILSTVVPQNSQAVNKAELGVEEQHIQSILNELPANSALREILLRGSRGIGPHQSWMDDMHRSGIKRAVIWIAIDFNRRGRPKKMVVKCTEFYDKYDGTLPVSDAERLKEIRASGLEQALSNLAPQRASNGFWVDIPRPKPKPFNGGTSIEFFDDELLPTFNGALYWAGTSCLPVCKCTQ
jgi:hypothetical protein